MEIFPNDNNEDVHNIKSLLNTIVVIENLTKKDVAYRNAITANILATRNIVALYWNRFFFFVSDY